MARSVSALPVMGALFSHAPPEPKPTSRNAPLILREPACEWLGDGAKALTFTGDAFQVNQQNRHGIQGRGRPVGVGLAKDAVALLWEGPDSHLVIRSAAEPSLALEVHYRQFVAGAGLSLWAPTSRRAKPCVFALNADRTLSPQGLSQSLVVGLHLDGVSLRLVPRSDPLRIVVALDSEAASTGTGAVAVSLQQQTQPSAMTPGAVPVSLPQHPSPGKFAGANEYEEEDPS